MLQVTFNLEGVFICDLGLAKLRDVAQGTMTTVSQNVIGTYPYMAPEMFSVSHRSAAIDIYSLGCLYPFEAQINFDVPKNEKNCTHTQQ